VVQIGATLHLSAARMQAQTTCGGNHLPTQADDNSSGVPAQGHPLTKTGNATKKASRWGRP